MKRFPKTNMPLASQFGALPIAAIALVLAASGGVLEYSAKPAAFIDTENQFTDSTCGSVSISITCG